MRAQIVALLVALVALSGCMAGQTLRESEDIESSSSPEPDTMPTTTSDTAPPQQRNAVPLSVQWNDCDWLGTAFSYPRETGPARPPDEWPTSRGLGYDIFLEFMDCSRFAWGPFERPLRMAFEYHSNVYVPWSCLEGDYTRLGIIHRLYTNSSEVSAWINETYGIPTMTAEIEWSAENGTVPEQTWSFKPESFEESSITAYASKIMYGNFPHREMRFFWEDEKGISYLAGSFDMVGYFPMALTPGEMHPPTLYSETFTTFPGRGEFASMEMTGTIHRFLDFNCEVPREESEAS